MKICPQCQSVYADDLNFCLEDGVTLVDSGSFDPQRTLSYAGDPIAQFPNQKATNEQNYAFGQNHTSFGGQFQKKRKPNLLIPVAAISSLLGITLAGIVGVYFIRQTRDSETTWYPTPTPDRSITPDRTPTPQKQENIKVEIKDTVKTEFGQKYLKCIVTNTGKSTVEAPSFNLSFYKNDVKIKDGYGKPELPFLKPEQSVPVWVNLYDTDGYTAVKLKEEVTARPATKFNEQIYPVIKLTETNMNAEKGGLMYNFRQYYKLFYKVSGIAENPGTENISTKIFVLYYDEKGEIVGVSDTYLSNLKPGEKTKFEVSECEIDLYGKPKSFEIIAIRD